MGPPAKPLWQASLIIRLNSDFGLEARNGRGQEELSLGALFVEIAVQACRTVVLVEDEPLLLEATTSLLVDDGCVVHPATNHDEALEILARNPHVTVVITDIALSGAQTGLDLADKVAGLWPRVRIIILSGRVRPDAAVLPGNALFCTKPCAPGALTTLVRQCVDW